MAAVLTVRVASCSAVGAPSATECCYVKLRSYQRSAPRLRKPVSTVSLGPVFACRQGSWPQVVQERSLAARDQAAEPLVDISWRTSRTTLLATLLALLLTLKPEVAYGKERRSAALEEAVLELEARIDKLPDKVPKSVIREPSGIVKARNNSEKEGIYWVNTDSGGPSKLWAVDGTNRVLAEVPINAPNVDWEDLAWGYCGAPGQEQDVLIIADTGNNKGARQELSLYLVAPPVISASKAESSGSMQKLPAVTPSRVVRFRFPQGHTTDFDVEAVFVYKKTVYLISKRRPLTTGALYRLPESILESCTADSGMERDPVQEAIYIADFESGSPVTAADVSVDEKLLAVLTKADILLYDTTDVENQTVLVKSPKGRIPVERFKQVEVEPGTGRSF